MNISIILYLIGLVFLILSIIELKKYFEKYQEIKTYTNWKKIDNGGIVKYVDLDLHNNIIIEYQFNGKNKRDYSLLNKHFKNRLDGVIYEDKLKGNQVDVYVHNDKTYLELNNLKDLGYPIFGILYLILALGFLYSGYFVGDYFDNFPKNIIRSIIL